MKTSTIIIKVSSSYTNAFLKQNKTKKHQKNKPETKNCLFPAENVKENTGQLIFAHQGCCLSLSSWHFTWFPLWSTWLDLNSRTSASSLPPVSRNDSNFTLVCWLWLFAQVFFQLTNKGVLSLCSSMSVMNTTWKGSYP